jgi:hypothetical protein
LLNAEAALVSAPVSDGLDVDAEVRKWEILTNRPALLAAAILSEWQGVIKVPDAEDVERAVAVASEYARLSSPGQNDE